MGSGNVEAGGGAHMPYLGWVLARRRPAGRSQRIATGATGLPVAPVNGSGVADSRNA